jgi:Mn2+/Fe2+ NRAMP family transporter
MAEKVSLLKKWLLFLGIIAFLAFIAALVASIIGIAAIATITSAVLIESKLAPPSKRWIVVFGAFMAMETGFLIMSIFTIGLVSLAPTTIILLGLTEGALFFLIGYIGRIVIQMNAKK